VVHRGANLKTIHCPHGGADSDGRWGEAVQERYDEGFATLPVPVPCRRTETPLDDLAHDWPMGFASFRIEVLHPNRGWLTEDEPASVTTAFGHPPRQILAHFRRTSSTPRRHRSTRVTLWIFRAESQARAIAVPSRRH